MSTVGELIKELETLDPNLLVVMSKDSEGNYYSPYSDVSLNTYVVETSWCGYLWDETDEEDDQRPLDAVDAVILWPVN